MDYKVITINPEKCSSCKICELACSFHHYKEYRPSLSRIKVHIFPEDFFYIPVMCFQCEDPICLNICPSGAIYQDEMFKAILVNPLRCVGCKMCMLACPFGNIGVDPESGCAAKCDLCGGDPQCVKYCFYGALEFVEAEAATVKRSRSFAEKIRQDLYK